MRRVFFPSLLTGLATVGLFFLVALSGAGALFSFLPIMPLLLQGLAGHFRTALYGGIIAIFVIASSAGSGAALGFWLMLALPAWYIAWQSPRVRFLAEDQVEWFPLGRIFSALCWHACALFVGFVFLYSLLYGDFTASLTQILQATMESTKEVPQDMQEKLSIIIGHWSFLVFAMSFWLWGLALYAHTLLALFILQQKQLAVRPPMPIAPFSLPAWLPSLLLLCALASLMGSPTLAFLGKVCFLALLLPYFYLGSAVLHTATRAWQNQRFFLFFVYLMALLQLWPALALAGLGLYFQIKRLYFLPSSTRS